MILSLVSHVFQARGWYFSCSPQAATLLGPQVICWVGASFHPGKEEETNGHYKIKVRVPATLLDATHITPCNTVFTRAMPVPNIHKTADITK